MAGEKRRDFLKKAGIFAGTLAMLSLFKSNAVNASTVIKAGSTEQLKVKDDSSIEFLPQEENNVSITATGDWIVKKTWTAQYVYNGRGISGGTQLIPLPYGMFYPINQAWGYDYNFVKEVRINGVPSSFSELTNASANGHLKRGRGAFGGFAWAVTSLSALNIGDTVQATIEQRELLDSVKGIRIGSRYVPNAGDLLNYSYAIRNAADDPTVPWNAVPANPPADHVFWAYPNISDYSILVFKLVQSRQSSYGMGGHGSGTPVHSGKKWRPSFTVNSETYQTGLSIMDLFDGQQTSSANAVKLGIFHKATGALSNPNQEIILRGRNYKAQRSGSWSQTLKLK